MARRSRPQQVNVTAKKKRPLWQWGLFALLGLFVCGALTNLGNKPTATNQAGLALQSNRTPTSVVLPTDTPIENVAMVATELVEPTKEPPTTIPPTPEPPTAIVEPPTIEPTTPPEPAANWTASASVEPQNPPQNGTVRITGKLLKDGKPYQGAVMNLNLEYKSKDTNIDGAKTKADGTAGQSVSIGGATKGFEVDVNVVFLVEDKVVARTVTSFTPR